MKAVHFHAAFNLQTRRFDVSVNTADHRYIEEMSVMRYEEFCQDLEKGKMKVGDMTVVFMDEGREVADGQTREGPVLFEIIESESDEAFQQVRAYFRAILHSFYVARAKGEV